MKKILLSTIVLTAFSLSIILFQISCKKEAHADTGVNSITQQNKILYLKEIYGPTGILYDQAEIWTANYDGSGQAKINIKLPSNFVIAIEHPKVSPDGKTIFFVAFKTDGINVVSPWNIYACNIDGSNVHQVIATSDDIVISDAY